MSHESAIECLDTLFPTVVKVHSNHHPELIEAYALYEELKKDPTSKDIKIRLRDVTHGFLAPEDACVSYVEVYKALQYLYMND